MRLCTAFILLSAALLGGCSRGPAFEGRLYGLVGASTQVSIPDLELLEYRRTSSGGPMERTLLAAGVFSAGVSASGEYAAYSTKAGLYVRDLRSGQITKISPDSASCIRWSPSGEKFAFTSGGALFVTGMLGPPELLLSAPGATYTRFRDGQMLGTLWGAGSMECPRWLAPDRLAVKRFTGPLPHEIRDSGALAANTMTIVNLTNPNEQQSLPGIDEFLDGCSASGLMIRRQLFTTKLTGDLGDFHEARGPLLSEGEWLQLRFAPPDCRLYYTDRVDGEGEIVFLDPATYKPAKRVRLGRDFLGDHLFHPNGQLVAFTRSEQATNLIGRKTDTMKHRIEIMDIETGARATLAVEKLKGHFGDHFTVLAWAR